MNGTLDIGTKEIMTYGPIFQFHCFTSSRNIQYIVQIFVVMLVLSENPHINNEQNFATDSG